VNLVQRYLELCLRLGRHVDGLVDSYYGPPEIQQRVESEEPRAPADLVADAGRLREENESAYLDAQLLGLETVARKLAGEEIPYADEVERCYGIRPHRVSEETFERAHRELDEALPPDGTLAERYQRWREGDAVPVDRLPAILQALTGRLRGLTSQRFGLPERETARLDFVTDEPWAAYNYYLGGLTSRVAVNTDVSLNASFVAELMAHELYPGHHTEHAWKESRLYRDEGRLEESALMIGAPQSLIAEGIAGLAIDMVVEDHDGFAAEVLGEFGIDYDADAGRRIREARGRSSAWCRTRRCCSTRTGSRPTRRRPTSSAGGSSRRSARRTTSPSSRTPSGARTSRPTPTATVCAASGSRTTRSGSSGCSPSSSRRPTSADGRA